MSDENKWSQPDAPPPPLFTGKKERDLVKQVKYEVENAKISIRNVRQKSNDEMKKLGKEGLSEDMQRDAELLVQEITHLVYLKKHLIQSHI